MTKNNIPLGKTISASEAADIAQVDPETIRRWIRKGLLNAWRFGERGRYRIVPDDVYDLIRNTKEKNDQ